MAAIEVTHASAAPAGIFSRIVAFVVAWNAQRATRNALSQLSDRELEDIGLCRGDINIVARNI